MPIVKLSDLLKTSFEEDNKENKNVSIADLIQPQDFNETDDSKVERNGVELTWDDVSGSENIDIWQTLSRDEKRLLALNKKKEDLKPKKEKEEEESISKLETMATNLGLSFLDFQQGVQRQSEALTLSAMQLLMPGKETAEEKIAMLKAVRGGNLLGSSESFNNIVNRLEENLPEYENQSITQDILEGNYAQAGFRAVNAALRSSVSLIAAATGTGGLMALGISTSGNKFEEEFNANPEETTLRLLANAGATGATEALFERFTRGLLKRAGLLSGQGMGQAAKELLEGGAKQIVKLFGYGVVGEGLSEAATELTTSLIDALPRSLGGLGKELKLDRDFLYKLGDAGIVGSLIGGKVSTVGAITNTSSRAKERAEAILMQEDVKQEIKTKVEEINELTDVMPLATKEGKSIINQKVQELSKDISDLKIESSKTLSNLKDKTLTNYSKNVDEINKVKNVISNAKTDVERNIAKEKYEDLIKQNKSILDQAKAEAVKKNTETIKKQIKEGGLKGKVTELSSEEISNIKEEGFDAEYASNQFGFIRQQTDGNFEIILNKDKPMVGTAAHEFMHAVLYRTINGNQQTRNDLGDALIEHVSKLGGDKSVLGQRLSNYGNFNQDGEFVRDDAFGEETITIMSESILDGSLKFEESFFTKIGDIIRRFSQDYLGKEIRFDTGRDVYNFVKDYTKSIKDGKINKAILKVAKEGVQGDLVKKVTEKDKDIVNKFSKDASDNVQRIYEEKGADGSFEIINEFKPIVSRIAEKRRGAPNFDKELLMSEIEIGERGILDLIKDYKPESGVPLAAYINKFLPARAIEASRRVLGEEFTQDVTEARTVEAREETTTETKPQRKKIVLADRLGVTDKVSKAIQKIIPSLDINKLNFKNLKNQIPDITGELFGIAPKKIKNLANLTKKELQSAQMFINKNADLLIAMLPEGATASGTATGVPNTLLKAFYTKTDRAKMAKTGSKAGLAIQEKNNIKKTNFLEVFGIVDGKPDRTDRNTSARVLALANLTGKMITNQAVRQKVGEADAKSKQTISRLKDGKSNIMFSKSTEKADKVKAIMKNVTNKKFKHGDISKAIGSKILAETVISRPSGKTGILKPAKVRDLFGKYNELESGFEARDRVANDFIEKYPQYFDMLRTTMGGGITISMFQTTAEFELAVPNPVSEQNVVKRFHYHKDKKLNPNAIAKIEDENFVKNEKAKLPLFKQFLLDVEAYLKDNPQDVWFFEEMTKDTQNNMNSIVRIVAPFVAYPIEDGKPVYNKIAIEEHSFPQIVMGRSGISAAIAGEVESLWPVIQASYMQMSLLEVDDNKVTASGMKSNVPDVFYEKILPRIINGELKNLPDGYVAFVRYAYAGVNLNNYKLLNGQTVAEFFGVDGLPIKQANDIIVKKLTGELDFDFEQRIQYPENYNENKTYSEVSLKGNVITNYSKSKGMSTFDFDETLIVDGKNFVVAIEPGTGKRVKISSANWPVEGPKFTEQGYTFDFSDFVKVRGGKEGPLLQKMRNQIKKYGPNNVFVLTARPQQSADAINGWLQSKDIKIPFKNITGLGNSTGEAKAMWMLEKFNEGYNDMYFVDDAMSNVAAVKNVLDQLDIKSKVVQAKIQFSKDTDKSFENILNSRTKEELDINKIIEQTTGVKAEARFSEAQAKIRGSKKSKFGFFVPPSAEDFKGLIYRFLGKGKTGEQQLEFFKKSLFDPFNRAYQRMNADRQSLESGYRALLKQFPKIKSKLNKQIGNNFTLDQAVRIYLFDKAGFEVPGLSKRDLNFVKKYFKDNSEAKSFAESLGNLTNQPDGYLQPTEFWLAETTASDINKINVEVSRDEALQEFKQNREKIFGKWQGSKLVGDNINKIEAIYGTRFKEALEDMLYRMEYGRRRETGNNRLVNAFNNWANQSVGAIMFFNMRSALLQTISSVNYLNWSDNNPLKAGAALANFPQFVKDFTMIFNSDLLKQRRGGQQRGINEAELAEAIAGSKNKAKAMLHWLLTKGFLPTQIADSFAIASGGALMYRNRVKSYLKQGLSQSEAESKAFNDFQEITEEGQQSARPDMISQQQASPLGRYILAFKNTPMQYARLMKKAILDLANNRGDFKSNVSKIIYYGAVQNLIFNGLQAALGSLIGDDEDEEQKTRKQERIINGMIDSVLSGLGFAGNVAVTVKNSLMEYLRQRNKNWGTDHTYTMLSIASLSPTIGSKLRRIYTGIQTERFNRDVIKEMGVFNIDNPAYGAIANVISGATNIPLDRLVKKVDNIDAALTENITPLERLALIMGWNTWDLGIEDQDIISVENEIKARKDKERKEKQKKKREESKIIRQEKNKKQEEENIKKKDGRCVAITSSGERCSNDAVEGNYCTIHAKVAQRTDGKKVQCKHIKADGKRCKMKTSNKSGFCYYHD